MALPEQRVLRNDLIKIERNLVQIEQEHGKHSPEYQDALKHFARIWSVLRLSHSQDDFLKEVISQ